MKKLNEFYKKMVSDEKISDNLKMFEYKTWDKLLVNKKEEVLKNIVYGISDLYPEFGRPTFNFIFMDDKSCGWESEEGTFINVRMLEEGNYFEVLAASLHELRHYFQRKACELYKKTGEVHELFSKEQLESFIENEKNSALFLYSNYFERGVIDEYEYALQPVEYDAENFSYEVMQMLSKHFYKDFYDSKNCKVANYYFDDIRNLYLGNENNIFKFNDIYIMNYKDNIKENRNKFNEERKKFEQYKKMLERIQYLNDEQIFTLLNCSFYNEYDDETRVKLLNEYLSNNSCKYRIELIDGEYYFKELLFKIKNETVHKIIEPLFLEVANEKVEEIASKNLNELLFGFEKDLKINLMMKENIINEDENPLLYRLQPYVLFRNEYVKNEYFKLIRAMDNVYDSYDNYISYFTRYIKKYDNIPIVKKAEILLGKGFDKIYKELENKMKNNIEDDRKTRK